MTISVSATKWSALCAALALAACDPGAPTYTGTVIETRGQCHTIAGDDKIRYALKAEASARFGLKPGQKIAIRGKVADRQDCAAAVVLIAEKVEAR